MINEENPSLIAENQPFLDAQQPKIQVLTKDKFGGDNFQQVDIQTNQISKKLLTSLWLERLILPSNLIEYLAKSLGSITLGSVTSLLVQASFVTSLTTIPLALGLWALYLSVERTHLQNPLLYLLSMFVFGFIVTFFF